MSVLNYFKIVRPLNLVIIVFCQLLFWICVVLPLHQYTNTTVHLATWQFSLLVISTVLIAAGGYVINDYYDLPIDLENKPDKVIINRYIKEDKAFVYYVVLTIVGLGLAFAVAHTLSSLRLVTIQIIAATLLWFYAQSFKRSFFIGNIIVSILTAWTIIVVSAYEIDLNVEGNYYEIFLSFLSKITVLYALFAFFASLKREIVKDIQDIEGDEYYGSKTLPIVLGIKGAKIAVGIIITISWSLLTWCLLSILKKTEWLGAIYILVSLILFLGVLFFMLVRASNKKDFGRLSAFLKLYMFIGISSMAYFYFFYSNV